MENFTNSILIPENLPAIDKQTFTPLDKRYLKILFIRLGIFFLLLTGAFVASTILSDEKIPRPLFVAIWIVLAAVLLLAIISIILAFSRKGYLVRENDISFQRGLIIYKVTSIPYNRIQHVEVNRGVLAKLFNLSSLKLYTAGGNASDLSIPGLPQEIALNLKAFLSEKISEHE